MPTVLSLLAVAAFQVDLPLDPPGQIAAVDDIVEIDLIAHADSLQEFAAIDAILSWDPAQLEFVEAAPGSFSWLVAGFLPDPDGINDDTLDGEALFTALSPPAPPASVPPDIVVTTLRFRVLGSGQLSLLRSSGMFGSTRVISTTPGVEITGDISGTANVFLGSEIPAVPPWGLGILVLVFGCVGFFVLRRSPG